MVYKIMDLPVVTDEALQNEIVWLDEMIKMIDAENPRTDGQGFGDAPKR